MGFGSNNNSTNDALDAEIAQSKDEMEQKRKQLYQTRLDIIKGQGAQRFESDHGLGSAAAKASATLNATGAKSPG